MNQLIDEVLFPLPLDIKHRILRHVYHYNKQKVIRDLRSRCLHSYIYEKAFLKSRQCYSGDHSANFITDLDSIGLWTREDSSNVLDGLVENQNRFVYHQNQGGVFGAVSIVNNDLGSILK